jgi:sn-glycerol 3-phosphate transport system permease protein
MVERTPFLNLLTQIVLFLALLAALAPFAIVAIAATHDLRTVNQVPMPLTPGRDFLKNLAEAWVRADLGHKLVNSIVFAGGVALGKVSIAALLAFSLVFFRYRGRVVIFWLIFITLMLPLEVRIVPTYAVAANALSPYQTIFDVTGITALIESIAGYRIALQWGCSTLIPGSSCHWSRRPPARSSTGSSS